MAESDEKALAQEMAHTIRSYEPDETIFGAPRAQSGIINIEFITIYRPLVFL
jgi:hypothetical protein